jgi:hypothetical protein
MGGSADALPRGWAAIERKGMRVAAEVLLSALETQAGDADERRAPGPPLA